MGDFFPSKRSAFQDTDEEEREDDEEDEDEGNEPVQLKTWAGLQPRMPPSSIQKHPSSSKPSSIAAAKTEEDSVTGNYFIWFSDSADWTMNCGFFSESESDSEHPPPSSLPAKVTPANKKPTENKGSFRWHLPSHFPTML